MLIVRAATEAITCTKFAHVSIMSSMQCCTVRACKRGGHGGKGGGKNEKGAQCLDFADTVRTMGGDWGQMRLSSKQVAFLLLSLAILFYSRSGSPGYQHFILEAAVFEMAFLLLRRAICTLLPRWLPLPSGETNPKSASSCPPLLSREKKKKQR